MRTVLLVIAIFLWGIWFEVADLNYVGEFSGSANQNFIGWLGFILLCMTACILFWDWFKKSNIMKWIKKKKKE
jgi:hypothetical protein